jgi:hypothetical protein
MSYVGETNEESCLSPLDSARFIMERARHVSINLSSLQKLSTIIWFHWFLFENLNFVKDRGWGWGCDIIR